MLTFGKKVKISSKTGSKCEKRKMSLKRIKPPVTRQIATFLFNLEEESSQGKKINHYVYFIFYRVEYFA